MTIHTQIPYTITLLSDLISYDVLGGQSNWSVLQYILEIFKKEGLVDYCLVPNEGNTKSSVHVRIGPSVDGGVILSGHTDVVPVEGQEWSTLPFQMTRIGDKLFGRGTADMKGFIACCLAMIPLFKKKNLQKPIYLAFSYDEEIGCLAGPELVESIRRHYTEKPHIAIIGEPSQMQPLQGHKGICVFETYVNGSAGHSSRIPYEVSAIHAAAHLIQWLDMKMKSLHVSGHTNPSFHPPHSTVHVGTLHGGIAPNVIADQCTFQWDVRTVPGDDLDNLIEEFNVFAQNLSIEYQKIYPQFTIKTTMHHPPVPPLWTDQSDPDVLFISDILDFTSWGTAAYAAEAGQFSAGGFATLICGPGDIAQAHRADEFIQIDQLNKCLHMLDRLATHLSV